MVTFTEGLITQLLSPELVERFYRMTVCVSQTMILLSTKHVHLYMCANDVKKAKALVHTSNRFVECVDSG
mgnify:CR=1 FL=1